MNLSDVQVKQRKDRVISIRTTRQNFRWMKKHRISPTKLFHKAMKELKGGKK